MKINSTIPLFNRHRLGENNSGSQNKILENTFLFSGNWQKKIIIFN